MEYTVLRIEPGDSPEHIERLLNSFGRRGWDLVCAFRAARPACECLVLKRDETAADGMAAHTQEDAHVHG
jgi:hypothetical protein